MFVAAILSLLAVVFAVVQRRRSSALRRRGVISIDGLIGCGKSTVIDLLKQCAGGHVVCLPERVRQWQSIGKGSAEGDLLTAFYNDSTKYACVFQMVTFLTRCKDVLGCNEDALVIQERCLHSGWNVFAVMLRENGNLSQIEFDVITQLFDWYNSLMKCPDPPPTIYISTSPENCKERLDTRRRVGEEGVKIEYLKKLEEYYNMYLNTCRNVVYVDGNQAVEDVFSDVLSACETLGFDIK
jgi:deoxyadenosine/deoxycytidine kinase